MKISTAQEAINGNSNDTVITPLRLKQVLNSKNIGEGGSSGGITNETDPIFASSPAAKITDEDIENWNSGTGGGGVIEETDPTVPDYVKQIKQEDIDKWNQNNDGEVEIDISSAIETIYNGTLLGGESVVLENHKRFLDVYFVVSLTNHRMFSKYTIDTTLTEPSYGGTTFPSSDSSTGVSSYVSEGMWEASTDTFTHTRTGYFNIEEGTFYERNARETYYIYRIDTYDDPLLEIKLPDVNVDIDDITSKMSKVLYDNPDGTNATAQLTETYNNFKYLEVFCNSGDNTYAYTRIENPVDGKRATVMGGWFGTNAYFKNCVLVLSGGDKINVTQGNNAQITGTNACSTAAMADAMKVVKVVGYYDENVLIVGNNGTEIVNTNKPKSIMTLHLDADVTCVTGVYSHLPLTIYSTEGDGLTYENGSVKIGKGVSKVKVSGCAKFGTNGTSTKHIHIDKNDTTVAWALENPASASLGASPKVTPVVIDVVEGDLIDLKYHTSTSGDVVEGHRTCYTYLTVEAVEDGQIITVNNTIDGIPIGSEFEYDGEEVPDGYEEVIEEVVEEKDPTCYYDGDTYVIPENAYINVGGCITASRGQIRFGIFVHKSLKYIKSITVNYAKLTIRYPDGGYIISELDVTDYLAVSNEGENVIYLVYQPSSAMSPTNNTPVSVEINGLDLTFNE